MIHTVTPQRMREMEQLAIGELGIPGLLLMEHAALGLMREIDARYPGEEALIVCGPGNNGGDGLALGRLRILKGLKTRIALLCDPAKYEGDARKNCEMLMAIGVPMAESLPEAFSKGIIVDALFGTGLTRPPEGRYREAIAWMNAQGVPIVAVDIPSGIDGASGRALGTAVRADVTVTFGHPKVGHYLYPGRAHTGKLCVCDIALPKLLAPDGPSIATDEDIRGMLPQRAADAHKGIFGHALIIAGSRGMAGAASLATQGALRAGAGLVTTACAEQSVLPTLQSRNPEAMAWPLREQGGVLVEQDLTAAFSGKRSVAIGPGLRANDDIKGLVKQVLSSGLNCVIDADGLNAYGGTPFNGDGRVVITPHPGEMARLLAEPVVDPIHQAAHFAKQQGVVVLLKGSTTVIAAPDGRVRLGITGTPGMATGGSGDVLTGIIAALLAQGLDPFDAATAGAYLHGRAGECAQAACGIASMTALDIAEGLRGAYLSLKR